MKKEKNGSMYWRMKDNGLNASGRRGNQMVVIETGESSKKPSSYHGNQVVVMASGHWLMGTGRLSKKPCSYYGCQAVIMENGQS